MTDFSIAVVSTLISVGALASGVVFIAKLVAERSADRWLESVKQKYEKELTQLRHDLEQAASQQKARLDHQVSVSRVQFDEEFRAVHEVWTLAARTRASVLAIVESQVPEDDTQQKALERFFERRARFAEDHRKLVLAVDNNSPFYAVDLYDAFDALRIASTREVLRLSREKPFEKEWFERRAAAGAEIVALADETSKRIRKRLGSVRIE